MAGRESSSLCFSMASQKFKDKEISAEEYYHHLLAHCTGYLHSEDDDFDLSPSLSLPHASPSLQSTDPFAYAVQCFMKRKEFLKDTGSLEDASKALERQDLKAIQEAASKLANQQQQYARRFFHKILAFRALQLRKAQVLRYCLDVGGFPYEAYFEEEANEICEGEDPMTFKVLEESHFRKLYPRQKNTNNQDEDLGEANITAPTLELTRGRWEREKEQQ